LPVSGRHRLAQDVALWEDTSGMVAGPASRSSGTCQVDASTRIGRIGCAARGRPGHRGEERGRDSRSVALTRLPACECSVRRRSIRAGRSIAGPSRGASGVSSVIHRTLPVRQSPSVSRLRHLRTCSTTGFRADLSASMTQEAMNS
jgi:hypothetical protein